MESDEAFGTTRDGQTVERHVVEGGGLTAAVLSWGAVVQNLTMKGHDAPLVLGFERFEDYADHSPYFGAVVGRYANRIAHGRFTIDGERYEVDRNFLGKHLLHGGSQGFDSRNWTVGERGRDFVQLTLHDRDGAMGFPGALHATCTYRLKKPATLSVELEARSDRATLCNLSHHSYFNLDNGGSGDILDHRLMLPASAYLPVDHELIPTGVVRPVHGTPFDFRHARPIRMGVDGEQVVYDHNFCLAAERGPLRLTAWLHAPSGIEMEAWTSEPGVQFYAGHHIPPDITGLGGRRYGPCSGLCLEGQIWPDSPNRPYFPQAVLRPGKTSRQVTEYRFRVG